MNEIDLRAMVKVRARVAEEHADHASQTLSKARTLVDFNSAVHRLTKALGAAIQAQALEEAATQASMEAPK